MATVRISKNGFKYYDNERRRAYNSAWQKRNKDKRALYDFKNALKDAYGITPEQYNSMFEAQGGRCAICGIHQSEQKRRLAVDHNHSTKQLRGLLCINCNTGIGKFKESTELLNRANEYIRKWENK